MASRSARASALGGIGRIELDGDGFLCEFRSRQVVVSEIAVIAPADNTVLKFGVVVDCHESAFVALVATFEQFHRLVGQ